jgi:hypothetical protein
VRAEAREKREMESEHGGRVAGDEKIETRMAEMLRITGFPADKRVKLSLLTCVNSQKLSSPDHFGQKTLHFDI